MEREHCHSTDSTQLFHTSNYGLDTRSDIEYYFVVDPEAGRQLAEHEKMIHPKGDSKRWWPANRTNTTATSNRTPIEGARAVAGVHCCAMPVRRFRLGLPCLAPLFLHRCSPAKHRILCGWQAMPRLNSMPSGATSTRSCRSSTVPLCATRRFGVRVVPWNWLPALNTLVNFRPALSAGGRLYTGPMFQKYNAVLRGIKAAESDHSYQTWQSLTKGNTCALLRATSTPILP